VHRKNCLRIGINYTPNSGKLPYRYATIEIGKEQRVGAESPHLPHKSLAILFFFILQRESSDVPEVSEGYQAKCLKNEILAVADIPSISKRPGGYTTCRDKGWRNVQRTQRNDQ